MFHFTGKNLETQPLAIAGNRLRQKSLVLAPIIPASPSTKEKMHAMQHGSFHACFVTSRTILACRQCSRLCGGQRLLVSPFQATITWRLTLCIRFPIGNGVIMAHATCNGYGSFRRNVFAFLASTGPLFNSCIQCAVSCPASHFYPAPHFIPPYTFARPHLTLLPRLTRLPRLTDAARHSPRRRGPVQRQR